MPIELHERLSEFSYGYGVTREVEKRLESAGLFTVPFLPSLMHEASLGFDVGFDVQGAALMLQFKLGQALRRFVPAPRPKLGQPFWRYHIDTAEPDGQFELLLKAEQDGADVFYVAPIFHDWEEYLGHYERNEVLENSLIVTPGGIRSVLQGNGISDGAHKIVYDATRAYVCSRPLPLATVGARDIAHKVATRLEVRKISLGEVLERILAGFERREAVRQPFRDRRQDSERIAYRIASDEGRSTALRQQRLSRLRASGRSREEAVALLVGAEAWSMGAQLIFVNRK
ncbi:hypothetical protein [Bradyrhizobium embrapense]|uniref:hypothetical protein n=1 Tax=Bradyrhizobium embrapense TaxID=630921 RepID=UPI00067C0194|nr:hypothetical protein [Bradyrhizobium embrapense]